MNLLARESEDFSGAEIEQAVISGLFDAYVAGRDLTTEDIQKNIQNTVPISQTMREEIGGLKEWARTRTVSASKPKEKTGSGGERKLEL